MADNKVLIQTVTATSVMKSAELNPARHTESQSQNTTEEEC